MNFQTKLANTVRVALGSSPLMVLLMAAVSRRRQKPPLLEGPAFASAGYCSNAPARRCAARRLLCAIPVVEWRQVEPNAREYADYEQ